MDVTGTASVANGWSGSVIEVSATLHEQTNSITDIEQTSGQSISFSKSIALTSGTWQIRAKMKYFKNDNPHMVYYKESEAVSVMVP